MGQIKVIAFDLMGVVLSEKDIDNAVFQDLDSHIDLEDSGFYPWTNNTYKWTEEQTNTQLESFFNNCYFVRDLSIFELVSKYQFVLASNHLSAIRNFLEKQNILKYFSPIIISSEIGFRKPDPKYYEILIDKIGEKPDNILFVDDTFENISSAQKMGLKVFNFNKNHDQHNLKYQIENELLKYR